MVLNMEVYHDATNCLTFLSRGRLYPNAIRVAVKLVETSIPRSANLKFSRVVYADETLHGLELPIAPSSSCHGATVK